MKKLCVALLFVLFPVLVFAQGTKEDYERSSSLAQRTQNKVFPKLSKPQWLSDNKRLWYREQLSPKSDRYMLVDAESGKREPAFDHAKLAEALKGAGFEKAQAELLPISRLVFLEKNEGVAFRCGGKWFQYDTAGDKLSELPKEKIPKNDEVDRDPPRASFWTGPETELKIVNATKGMVTLFWLDTSGRPQDYGKMKPGEERVLHTYAGHVWAVHNGTGSRVAVYVAEEGGTTERIESLDPMPRRPRPPRRNGNGGEGPGGPMPSMKSPDGVWEVFYKSNNLWLRAIEKGEEFALTTDGAKDDSYGGRAYWSPDSKKLVVMKTKKGDDRKVYIVESSPKDQLQPKLISYDYLKPGDKVPVERPQLFDLASVESSVAATSSGSAVAIGTAATSAVGSVAVTASATGSAAVASSGTATVAATAKKVARQVPVAVDLFANPYDLSNPRWESDSKRFTFVYNERGHQTLRIVAVDATTGEAKAIVDERSKTFIDYSGKQFAHYVKDSGEIIWMSERDGWNHLYLYDGKTGEVKNQITKGEWVVRGVDRVDEKARQVWFRAGGIRPGQDPYYIHFCRVNFDGTGLVILTEGDGTHTVDYSPDGRFMIDTWSRVDMAPVVELRKVEDGKLVCELARGDLEMLKKTGWQTPERFVAKARDGETDIYGVIYRPTNFDPSKKYPIVEDIYAGPQDSFVPKDFLASTRTMAMAELGFIVVKIDGLGTSNRSKKFHDVCWKNLVDAGLPDRILWIKAAAAKYGYMDLDRIGICGGSAGGQNALGALLTHGDFYKVGVADCGCHDNRMDKIWWNEQWMGYPIGPHYAEQSNVTLAPKLTGKLMLVVGELDHNVDPASTMQVVNALEKANKDFELVVVTGADHGAAETPYGNRRRADFLVRHLLGVEPRSK